MNPSHTIGEVIGRAVSVYLGAGASRAAERTRELLEMVDLPREFERRYPGQLSGGAEAARVHRPRPRGGARSRHL